MSTAGGKCIAEVILKVYCRHQHDQQAQTKEKAHLAGKDKDAALVQRDFPRWRNPAIDPAAKAPAQTLPDTGPASLESIGLHLEDLSGSNNVHITQ
jgi:hypothetical protein